MPIPKPGKDEKQDEFISRCISELHEIDPDRSDEQITAICYQTWRDSREAGSRGGVELSFMAAVHSIASRGDRHATFYIMNVSRNRNGWRVTEDALEEALPSLLGKPLGCIPGYRANHVHKPLQVGKIVKVDGRGRYALATAEIIDDVAWEKLDSGEFGPVSVVITAYRVTCSKCGSDVTDEPDEHISSGEGYEIIESFKFNRVDFVGTPAYPQAGIITLDELRGAQAARARMASYTPENKDDAQRSQSKMSDNRWDNLGAFAKAPEDTPWNFREADYTLAQLKRASAYVEPPGDKKSDCHLPHHLPDGTLVWRGVDAAGKSLMGARGGYKGPGAAQAKKHLTPHYHAFDREAPWESKKGQAAGSLGFDPNPEEKRKMTEELAELKQKLEQIEKDYETAKTENQELRNRVEAMEAERHQEFLDAAVEARVAAGLMKREDAESLKDLDDETLLLIAEDARSVAERLEKAKPVGPKTKYTRDDSTEFEASVAKMREKLGFEPRVKEADE